MNPWLKITAGGLMFAAALAAASPAAAFYPYMTRPVWAPPPNMPEIDIDAGFEPTVAPPPKGVHARFTVAPAYQRQVVVYPAREAAGTIIVDTRHNFLYLLLGHGEALRYGVGSARPGFGWHGVYQVTAKREWPGWTPPAEMVRRQPGIPLHMAGGIDNPLGARALYIGRTLYRIHGTNQPWTIGEDMSSGCIRMTNADVIDLYARAKIGAKVIVL